MRACDMPIDPYRYDIPYPILMSSAAKLRNTFSTRMLFTILPSERYAPKGVSLQVLLKALADDIKVAETQGVEAPMFDP